MTEEKPSSQEIQLEADQELRFEVRDKNEKIILELKNGSAELFGSELLKGKRYEFGVGSKVAVFTYQGCTLDLTGNVNTSYVAKETPMALYLNTHAALEQMRQTAEKEDGVGPIVMVVGPTDVGKSTLCRILLNYAVRMGRKPIFVDLDVGQGNVAVPGTIGALLVERASGVVEGFSQQAPLVFHFGHKAPSANLTLYNLLVSRLAEVCADRLQANKKSKASGMIINTCGWVDQAGYKLLTHVAQAFEVDAIIVLDRERLYNLLIKDIPGFVKVVLLPKSGGVVERSQPYRLNARNQRIHEYFYGGKTVLHPHSFEVKWSDAKIYRIGPVASNFNSCTRMKADEFTKLVPVSPGPKLLYHILSVSFADSSEDDVVQTNVAGFVCVMNVDMEKQTFTVLSPQPQPLPNTVLLLSEIEYCSQFKENR